MDRIDMRRLRGILAEAQVSHTEFARMCALSRAYISTLLNGERRPGERAASKMRQGLVGLGLSLESEARRAS